MPKTKALVFLPHTIHHAYIPDSIRRSHPNWLWQEVCILALHNCWYREALGYHFHPMQNSTLNPLKASVPRSRVHIAKSTYRPRSPRYTSNPSGKSMKKLSKPTSAEKNGLYHIQVIDIPLGYVWDGMNYNSSRQNQLTLISPHQSEPYVPVHSVK